VRATTNKRLVPVTSWVHPSVRAAYKDIAKTEGLSLSKVTGTYLAESLARRLQVQHAGIIGAVTKQSVEEPLKKMSRAQQKVALRTYYAIEHSRAMLFNVLRWHLRLSEAEANTIIDGAKQDAERSVKRLAAETAVVAAKIVPGPSQAE